MSVLVKGMKMPENCGLCDLFHAESPMHCTVAKGHKTVGAPYGIPRPDWCPLVALPDKHGRLVDADELKTAFPRCDNNMSIKIASVRATINHMDTIVEAEGE